MKGKGAKPPFLSTIVTIPTELYKTDKRYQFDANKSI